MKRFGFWNLVVGWGFVGGALLSLLGVFLVGLASIPKGQGVWEWLILLLIQGLSIGMYVYLGWFAIRLGKDARRPEVNIDTTSLIQFIGRQADFFKTNILFSLGLLGIAFAAAVLSVFAT
ncbi:hypothetical protein [Geobacillus subterraneus]|uniref:hypothetical protein n=1 Tax=Geobacillus subterraneus TaxID=129338 RepID=UPI00155471CD|nr:hypothetical protein [Geobacillus subterraneus]